MRHGLRGSKFRKPRGWAERLLLPDLDTGSSSGTDTEDEFCGLALGDVVAELNVRWCEDLPARGSVSQLSLLKRRGGDVNFGLPSSASSGSGSDEELVKEGHRSWTARAAGGGGGKSGEIAGLRRRGGGDI